MLAAGLAGHGHHAGEGLEDEIIALGVGERTIATALAYHLRGVFPGYHIDVEYNRHGIDVKRVKWMSDCRQSETPRVYPDILVHQRGHDDANVLVVEIKRNGEPAEEIECDRQKLAAMKSEFRYAHSLLLIIPARGQSLDLVRYEWNGHAEQAI